MKTIALILAAGKGSRMRSELPKPLVRFKNKPMAEHIIESFEEFGVDEIRLIVGHKHELIQEYFGERVKYTLQEIQNGTGHAVMQAQKDISEGLETVFVFVGDSPLITQHTISNLYTHHKESGAACTFLTADFPVKLPWARVVRDADNKLIKCVEEKNATEEEKEIDELLSSHFVFDAQKLFNNLHKIQADKDNGEYYLTDMIDIFLSMNEKVETLKISNYYELLGLNTPEEITWAENF